MSNVSQESVLIAESFYSDRTFVAVDLGKHFVGSTATTVACDLYPQRFVNSMTVLLLKTTAWSTTVSNPLTSTVNIYISDQDLIAGEEFSVAFRDYFFNSSSTNIPINLNIYTVVSGQTPNLIKQIVWAPVSNNFTKLQGAAELIRIFYSKDGSFKLITSKSR